MTKGHLPSFFPFGLHQSHLYLHWAVPDEHTLPCLGTEVCSLLPASSQNAVKLCQDFSSTVSVVQPSQAARFFFASAIEQTPQYAYLRPDCPIGCVCLLICMAYLALQMPLQTRID